MPIDSKSPFWGIALQQNALIDYEYFRRWINDNEIKKADNSKITYIIKNIIINSEKNYFDTILNEGIKLYRARPISYFEFEHIRKIGISISEDNKILGCNYENSKEAPSTNEGRCNKKGECVVYFAEDEYTACCEVKPILGQLISLSEFRVLENLRLLDLNKELKIKNYSKAIEYQETNIISINKVIEQIMSEFAISVINTDEYKVSQYIASIAKECGYNGLRYQSSLTGQSNIVIFNGTEFNHLEFVQSRITCLHSLKNCFVDFNMNNILECTNEYNEPDSIIIDKMKNDLIISFKSELTNNFYNS